MALRCLDERGESVEARQLSEEWMDLDGRSKRILRLPCCEGEPSRRTSRNGTRFFGHRRRGGCTANRETESHRALNVSALDAARSAGWTAQTDVKGTTPDERSLLADVLAERGGRRLAIESEWLM